VETKKSGFRGFVKGSFSGISGVFLKPLSGGLDFIAKSTEGVKNTAKLFGTRVQQTDRKRLPRVIYSNQETIKSYQTVDAYIQNVLVSTKDGKFKNDHFVDAVVFQERSSKFFLIMTEEHVILIESSQKSVKWDVLADHLTTIEQYETGLQLNLAKGKKKVAIEIGDLKLNYSIYLRLGNFVARNNA